MYTLPLYHIIRDHNLAEHFDADKMQILVSCDAADLKDTIVRVEACVSDMIKWLLLNNQCLNSNKTELIVLGTKQQLVKIDYAVKIHVGSDTVTSTQKHK